MFRQVAAQAAESWASAGGRRRNFTKKLFPQKTLIAKRMLVNVLRAVVASDPRAGAARNGTVE